MAAGSIFVLSVAVSFVIGQEATLYSDSNYRGGTAYLDDLYNYYYYLTDMNDEATSVRINRGSCIVLWEHCASTNPCYGASVVITWPQMDVPNIGLSPYYFNDKTSGVTACTTTNTRVECPVGSFVKSIKAGDELRKGIEAHCYFPANVTSIQTIRTHPSSVPTGNTRSCDMGPVRGIRYTWQNTREYHQDAENVCEGGESSGLYVSCGRNQAVTGFETTIENESQLTKSSGIYCGDVGDPAADCGPRDDWELIVSCDNILGSSALECKYIEKVGIGNSSTASAGETHERQFYAEMDFNFGGAGHGLSVNFGGKLGESETTGFHWETASSQTWSIERTTEVGFSVPPGKKATLSRTSGKCSFFSVTTNFYKRVDTDTSGNANVTHFDSSETLPSGFKYL